MTSDSASGSSPALPADLQSALAFGPARVVAAVGQRVVYAGGQDPGAESERDLPASAGVGLEQEGPARRRVGHDRLVHAATTHPDVVVLGAVGRVGGRVAIEAAAGQRGECGRRGKRERRGRREPRAGRKIGHHGQPRPLRGLVPRPKLPVYPQDVIGPAAAARPGLAPDWLPAQGGAPERVARPGTRGDPGPPFYGEREHRAAVVVQMLADEVDPPGGGRDHGGQRAERPLK
jgi:hypothetical protein